MCALTGLSKAAPSPACAQPFNQRHPGYLSRYTTTMEPHIMNSVREVVAINKARQVFPLQLCECA